ncbi:MAG: ABC transporter ATP-binding protein [Bacillota bacterium]|jgi:ABC-type multidrug transport system ATPase subunit
MAVEYVCVVEGLCKTYGPTGVVANRDLNLRVSPGEVLGLFGPNGAGKTTLVRQIMGLLRPTSGSISILGHDVVRNPGAAPVYAAYHAQRQVMLASYRATEVLAQAGVLRGMRTRDAISQACALLEAFGLAGRSGSLMLRLSGGERQMVFLLYTFMGDLSLVILDEPTSNLDPVRRRLVWDFLRERAHEGIAIILVTHNVAEADQAVHRAVVVDRGTVVADGTPGDLKRMVSRKIEIRVSLKPGAQWLLADTARGEPLGGGRWIIRADPEESSQVLSHIIETQGLDGIDDFAVSGVSMDAVYEALTGEWWDERHERAIN